MVTATAPNFARGGAAAEEIAEAHSGGSGFRKTYYLGIDPEKSEVLRYITDSPEWITVLMHTGVPTKNPPAGHKGNWPKTMNSVCRRDPAFAGIYDDCYICDNKIQDNYGNLAKPKVRVWALAVLRDEVREDGKRVGYKDRTREVEVKGSDDKVEKVTERAIVVVNQPVNNYFGGLQAAFNVYGSVSDRDFVVQRKGDGKDSKYSHTGFDVTPNLKPGTESWERYDKALEEQGLDLAVLVASKASDEYYADLFDPSKASSREKADSDSGASSEQQSAAPSNDEVADEERRNAIRDRVRSVAAPSASFSEVD